MRVCRSELILVAEDDPPQRFLLQSWLKQAGYRVHLCANGEEARVFLEQQWADLALIDWDMPGMDGQRLLQWIRRRTQTQLPVVFQTVHSSSDDVALILNAGADDFLIKPVDRVVLLARLGAVLRRYMGVQPSGKNMQLNGVSLEGGSCRLMTATCSVILGTKEFEIAWYLARHVGAVVLRQELFKAAWGGNADVETRTIDMYVSRLRARLKECQVPWQIQSIYGRGYRLCIDGDGLGADADAVEP